MSMFDMKIYKVSITNGREAFIEVYSTWDTAQKRYLQHLEDLEKKCPKAFEILKKNFEKSGPMERLSEEDGKVEYICNYREMSMYYGGYGEVVSIKLEEADLGSGIPCDF